MENAADIYTILAKGGPLAVASLALAALCWERVENRRLTKQVLELATSQVEIQVENKMLLKTMRELLTHIMSKL